MYTQSRLSMINSTTNALTWFFLPIVLFFFIDICMFSFYSQPMSYLLLCAYVFYILVSRQMSGMVLIVLLLLLEFFLYYGRLITALFYFVPMTIVISHMHQVCYLNRFLYITASIGALLGYVFFIEGIGGDAFFGNYCTGFKIVANIILIMFFSLKLPSQSNLGSRCLG